MMLQTDSMFSVTPTMEILDEIYNSRVKFNQEQAETDAAYKSIYRD
jgi:hypothetical protein